MKRVIKAVGVFVILLRIAAPADAHAQDPRERRDTAFAAACHEARQTLTDRFASAEDRAALHHLGRCAATGPAAVAEAWSHTDLARRHPNALYRASILLKGPVVVDQVRQVAADRNADVDVRLNALRTLGTYVDPHLGLQMRDLRPRSDGRVLIASSVDHPAGGLDAQPLPPRQRDEILALLDRLVDHDPNPEVRFAAEVVRRTAGGSPEQ